MDKKRAMIKRKYFVCGGFRHIAYYCRNVESIQEKRLI